MITNTELSPSYNTNHPSAPATRLKHQKIERTWRSRWHSRPSNGLLATLVCFVVLLATPHLSQHGVLVAAGNYYQYNRNYGGGNYNGNNNNNGGGGNYGNYNNNDDGKNDDGGDGGGDDYYANNDDGGNNYNNDDTDDAGNAYNDDANEYNVYNNDDADDDANGYGGDKGYSNAEAAAYANVDDDVFHWNSNVGFDGVSVMPISCIN